MTINIYSVGMELTPALRQYVEEKFASLDKFASNIMQLDVHIGKETNHHQKGDIYTCSANVEIPGDLLKIERTAQDQYKAIDKVKDHLRETLAQRKEREIENKRRSAE
jgi:putative sigma-54 modulation protein